MADLIFNDNLRARAAALLPLCVLATLIAVGPCAPAQTITVLHGFTYGADGADPVGGLSQDAAGNLYGVTYEGGLMQCSNGAHPPGCGVVFKLTHHSSGWVFGTLYEFSAPPDGGIPYARVVVGPDGALYGTTSQGGNGDCPSDHGCGTVFKLQPPANFCGSLSCRWTETILYNFSSHDDGYFPAAEVHFDSAGNLYGTTKMGGGGTNCQNGNGCGTVFKLTHNHDGSWSKSTIHVFQGGSSDGHDPMSGVVLDTAGNVYGTTSQGGTGDCNNLGCGTVFELKPSGSGWTETVLYNFMNGLDGYNPGQLTFDGSGNLYGPSWFVTIFKLTPQGGGWQFSVAYTFDALNQGSSPNALTIDASNNIYGTFADAPGSLYRLTPAGSGWNFTTLYSFSFNPQGPGNTPAGNVVLDSQGNIYGENLSGAQPPYGTVWELTQ